MAARLLVGLVIVASSLFAVVTIVGSAATSHAQTTDTTNYAPTPTTAPATTVAPATTLPPEPLPHTGTDVERAIAVAAVIIAIGGLMVLAVRTRQRHINV
jgi:hypothetical protein